MDNAMIPRFGGPMGRHASPRGLWFNPLPWITIAATILFVVLFLRHVPCVQTLADNPVNAYIRACYSDIQTTFLSQGFGRGESPLGSASMLFPPLIAVILLGTRKVSTFVFDAPIRRSASMQDQVDASITFFALTAVGLFVCFLILCYTVAALGRDPQRRGVSWDGMLIAAAPIVLAAGLISWDLVPLALTGLGLVQFAKGRPFEAGIVLGLAASAGTMPIGIVLAVVVASGLRGGWGPALKFGVPAVVTFFAVHLPLMIDNFDRVYAFYHQEINKETGYGSLWYLGSLLGAGTRHTGSLAFLILMLVLGVLIAYLYVAGKRPRVGSMIAVVVFASAVLGPAFPPQTSLWLLLALVLARPWRPELVALNFTQVAYYLAIWGWLGGGLTTNQSGPYLLYWLAIVGHAVVQIWILIEVVSDIVQPSRDPLWVPDDPLGGALPGLTTPVAEVARPEPLGDPLPA